MAHDDIDIDNIPTGDEILHDCLEVFSENFYKMRDLFEEYPEELIKPMQDLNRFAEFLVRTGCPLVADLHGCNFAYYYNRVFVKVGTIKHKDLKESVNRLHADFEFWIDNYARINAAPDRKVISLDTFCCGELTGYQSSLLRNPSRRSQHLS